MGSRKPEKILVETSPIELVMQAASSHYPLFNWYQQFMSQRHARNTDAETFVLFHIWVPRSLAVGTGKPKGYEQSYWFPTNPGYCKVPRGSHLAFVKKNLKVSPRNLYTWTWPQQWERFSTGRSRWELQLDSEGCSFAPKNCILMAWFSAMLSSWCDLDVTGQSLFPNIIETHSHQNSMQCPFWLTSQLDRGADSLPQWLVGYYPQWHFGVLKVHTCISPD